MKVHPLETRHPKLSNESRIFEFGSQTGGICLFEVGVVAGVNVFNVKRVKVCECFVITTLAAHASSKNVCYLL